ncbi:hypothetical protein [Aquibacillus sediminis]|uniref:hypothetical protein n=1 Tax=Aquibacillus sediminis TaxID=2574734 RepID=UPI001109CE4E|nr:hypothetical protein [Aquibacillus sediminis]
MNKFKSFIIFFIPFLLFFFYFTNQHGHKPFSANPSHAEHGYVEVPDGYDVPSVKIAVTMDQSNTWLLEVQTKNFTFNPKKVGAGLPSYNEGHAHLYINGEKINRLYGNYYNLGKLKQGKNTITVTLNSNNHSVLMNNGNKIEDRTVVSK